MFVLEWILAAGVLLTSALAWSAEGPGVVCLERSKKPNGAFVAFERGRGTPSSGFEWAGLETSYQVRMSENEWPLGTYAGVSPYGDHVVLTIHTIRQDPRPRSEFLGTLTFFEVGEPRVDPVDCYFRP